MVDAQDTLVFLPLGGLSEIGMNAALYGFGPPGKKKWILIDLGIAFAGPELPGIELILPDIAFVESIRNDLLALVITHAHEDHIGAIAQLWPRLKCPVYATRFAAQLLEVRRLSEPGAPDVPLRIVKPGDVLNLGPFAIEYVPVAHSIPESCALAITTPAGVVVHTGDWKIDAAPIVGWGTDEARLRALGDAGVLALVCDSTNIMREGMSPSEAEVAATLRDLIATAPARVLVTTFASNVARLRAVADAALAVGRSVALLGRSMDRTVMVARECGFLDGLPPFLGPESIKHVPREKMVVLATGSQGEERAAMARIAQDEHPALRLSPGDRVIFSSRPIPGNERSVNIIVNGLARQGIEIVTDRDALVHASGHPRRGEVERMYEWTRPRIAIPAHGEAMHLRIHADFARERGIAHVIKASDGDVVLLGPGDPAIIDQVPHGRLYADGSILLGPTDEAIRERVRLSFAGVVSVGIAITGRGELAGDPDVVMAGVPARGRDGVAMDALVDRVIFETLDNLPKQRRRDADSVSVAVERAVRNALRGVWGKRPVVHVLVMQV
jgi:ribonuclease J